MLNQLLRFTLVSSVLLWLRPRWRGLLVLAAFVVMVHLLHGEYLRYVELSQNQSFLVWSYGIKWLALVIGVSVYMLFAFPSSGNRNRMKMGAAQEPSDRQPDATVADDGFDFLRRKKSLESRAEKVLSKKLN